MAIKELYKTLKDHKNPFMQELVTTSYQCSFHEEYRSLRGLSPLSSQELEDCGRENVVRVTLINPSFQQSLTKALEKMIEAKLQIDKFGFNSSNTTKMTGEKRLSDKLTILVNDITIAMQQLEYASYRGKIYKRDPKAKYTYSFKCEARPFINTIATNEHFKSRLIREMKKVIELLSDPHCELFQPLMIDYDLIEVNGGICWSIKKRAFVQGAINANNIGKISPRAFCAYDSTKDPDPKYFKEILENSLSPDEVAHFCDDFLKLLNYNKKQHKDKVPCLVGEANSGKTSLFFPIQGLIHHGNIATVTKQRAFNKAMITPFTEVIFIDEASESALDIADWKVLTQGGYSAHDVKYQTAKAFLNKCPMIITAQHKLQFGPTHQPAMEKRLRTYVFKTLPNPKKSAAAWLKKHAMDCVVWATEKAKNCQGDSESDENNEDDTDSEDEEGFLQDKEKEELRSITLASSLVEETTSSSVTNVPQDSESVSMSDDVLDALNDFVGRSYPGSLQRRQREHILKEEQRKRATREDRRRQQHEMKKQALLDKGISVESVEMLPLDPYQEMPSPLQREVDNYCRDKRAREEEQCREKAARVFEGSWLLTTEREFHDCVRLLNGNLDKNRRASINAHLEVLQDKLKNHHSNLGTLGSKEALAERKRVCRMLGLLTEEDENLVKSLTEPLPLATVENNYGEEEREDEEQDLFITPRTPSYVPRLHEVDQYWPQSPCSITTSPAPDATLVPSSALSPAQAALANVNDLVVSEELLRTCTTKKRKDRPLSQVVAKRRKPNTLLDYFSTSQK